MRRRTFVEGFRSTVRRYPDAVAVLTPAGRSVTYRELDARSDALAAALDDGLGDARMAGLAENRLAIVEAMLASMKRGRAIVQLPTRGAVGGLASMVETGGARGLLFDSATAETAAELVERVDLPTPVGIDAEAAADVDGAALYEDVLDDASPSEAPGEPATDPPEYAVHFTSGSTGEPKAVLVDGEQTWLAANQPALEMGMTAADRALVCTPWYHGVTCFTWIFAHLLVGARLVLQRSFEPAATLRLLDAHDATGLLAVPTQLDAMLAAQDDVGADLSALSYVRTGGAVVPERLIAAVRERFADGVFNTYGLTEAVVDVSFAYPWEQAEHPGTIGKGAFCREVRVVEPADPPAKPDPGAVVGPGGTGEILVRGPMMADGYLDRPEESEALFVEEPSGGSSGEARGASGGWLRTGDVARVDEAGYLTVVDRIDDMIVSGGENVYPQVVARALTDHPGVRDAGVVGLPDERWREVVSAAVVVGEDVTEADLERHCRDHDTLAAFKRPRRYVLLTEEEELPRTATGTLDGDAVRALFED